MIEKISNILGDNNQYLNRIYLSMKLQQEFRKIHQDPVKLVIKGSVIYLNCKSQAQATFFRLRRRQVYGIVTKVVNSSQHYSIRFRVDG